MCLPCDVLHVWIGEQLCSEPIMALQMQGKRRVDALRYYCITHVVVQLTSDRFKMLISTRERCISSLPDLIRL